MSISILKPGMLATIQDLGRFGHAHLGISPAGAADALAMRFASRAVGNDENAPAIEMTLVSAGILFDKPAVLAIGGAALRSTQGVLPCYEPIQVPAGFVLESAPLIEGARSYLVVRGGFKVPLGLGSASTLFPAGFGGLGRALKTGDVLQFGSELSAAEPKSLASLYGELRTDGPIRVTPGPQWHWFDDAARHLLFSSTFHVSEHSDRAGLRLSGPKICAKHNTQLLTEGVALGAMQITGDGQPIILFVDQQTTGGYPKIVNVASVDLHRIGQLRPRDPISFSFISIGEAVQLLRRREKLIAEAFSS
jgi:antagonist of KipI